MAHQTTNIAAQTSNITRFEITSNGGKKLDVSLGSIQLQYYESILDNTVRASAILVDSGTRTEGLGSAVLEMDDLKLTGGEKVELELEDNRSEEHHV